MGKMKRVLLFCQHFYPEMISTGMHMTELFLALHRIGWNVSVCTAQPTLLLHEKNSRISRRMEYQGVKIYRVRTIGSHSGGLFHRLLLGLSYFWGSLIFLIANWKKMDCIALTTNPPFLGLIAVFAKKVFGKPFLQIVYDVYPDIAVNLGVIRRGGFIHQVWARVSRIILKNADCNVVIGRDMLEIIGEKVGNGRRNKLILIPNWSDDECVFPIEDSENELKMEWCAGFDMTVQYSGRMARTHNLEPLIEAADILKGHPILFQFIGDGAKKKALQEMVEDRNLANVRFYSYQPLDKLNKSLSMANVAVVCIEKPFIGLSVPSKAYGIMAAARPILGFVSPQSEIGRMIEETRCGVLIPEPNGESVAETLLGFAKNMDLLKLMGERGYREYLRNYTLKVAADRYSKALSGMITRSDRIIESRR